LSGKSSKKLRREAEESLRRKDGEKVDGYLKGMLRGRFLKYAFVTTALALGGVEMFELRPFITGSKPYYDLTLVLLEHAGENNAIRFLNEMDSAKESGHPYKILFTEAATQPSSTYEVNVLEDYKNHSVVREKYLSLLDNGYPKIQAEIISRKMLSDMIDPKSGGPAYEKLTEQEKIFNERVLMGAIARGLKVLPLESRSADQIENVGKAYERFNEIGKNLHEFGSDLSLHDLVPYYSAALKENFQFTAHRNQEIDNEIGNRFRQAVKIFPRLWLERLKGTQLRAIAFIGLSHGKFFSKHKDVDISQKQYDSPTPISTSIMPSPRDADSLTEMELYLIALEDRYLKTLFADPQSVQHVLPSQDSKAIIKRLIDNTLDLTEAQIKELDKNSSKIKDTGERWAFILNQLLGEELFKKEMFK
jgi:mRNA-degrading endonuclease HigB of HigAB toxin-antitoxin module